MRRTAALILAVGGGLRLWQFLANRSLWLDELAVARNVATSDLATLLLQPLAFDQIAPPGFLATSWLLHTAVPDADWPLRLVPLIASIAILPVVYAIGRRMAGPGAGLGALALVSLSPALISVGSVTKQYSLDVLVTALLVYIGLALADEASASVKRAGMWGVIGAVLLPFSYPSVLVAAALGVSLVVIWLLAGVGREAILRRSLAFGVPLGASAAVTTVMALRVRTPAMSEYMDVFWEAGFPDGLLSAPRWLGRQVLSVLNSAIVDPYPYPSEGMLVAGALGVLALAGVGWLLRSDRTAAWLATLPVVSATAAAVAGLYPLDGRVSFFLAAPLAVLAGAGTAWLVDLARATSRMKWVPATAVLLVAAPLGGRIVLDSPPWGIEHMRPIIRAVAAERLETDAVWSYYGATPAVAFYGGRFSLGAWQAGTCSRRDPVEYLREMDRLRGRDRVWVIFSHALPVFGEYDIILRYLRSIGTETIALEDQMDLLGSSAYLFDLSDPERLQSTDADAFDLGDVSEAPERLVCDSGPLSPMTAP